MTTTEPVPYYRCLAVQLILALAIPLTVAYWYADGIAEHLAAKSNSDVVWWWSVLEFIVKWALLPAAISLACAAASYVLAPTAFQGFSLAAGPAVAVANFFAASSVDYTQWIVGTMMLLLAGHLFSKLRWYWATLHYWFSRNAQLRDALAGYNQELAALARDLHVSEPYLLHSERKQSDELISYGNGIYVFAPTIREAEREAAEYADRIRALLKQAQRRQQEPMASRRDTLVKVRRELAPLYDTCRRTHPKTFNGFAQRFDIDLIKQEPTPKQWETLSSDHIRELADKLRRELVKSLRLGDETADQCRVMMLNEARLFYRDRADLLDRAISRDKFDSMLQEADQVQELGAFATRMRSITDTLHRTALRQRLTDYYDRFSHQLRHDFPRDALHSQMTKLLDDDVSPRMFNKNANVIEQMIDAVTKPTREELTRREQEAEALAAAAERARIRQSLLALREQLARLDARQVTISRSGLRPDEQLELNIAIDREKFDIRERVAIERNGNPEIFDEVATEFSFDYQAA